MAKKRSDRDASTFEEALATLTRRLDELETIARGNRRILDLQFKRMADMQVEIDRLTELKKTV